MWTTKIGAVGAHLLMGLTDNGGLFSFGALEGPGGGAPQLRMRLRNADPSTAVSRAVTSYTDTEYSPARYNSQVVFTSFTGIVAGVYLCEVDAQVVSTGEPVTFPSAGYFLIRFLRGVD